MAKKRKFDKDLQDLIYITISILIILLSIFNLKNTVKKEEQILGIKTDNTYWEKITIEHPTYRDAWIELGRLDKVKQIDPNWKPDKSE